MSTAYLEPGDQVYVAVPVSPVHHTREAAYAEGKQLADAIAIDFAQHGVTVAHWSAHSQLSHPVIVAVFRPSAAPSTSETQPS
jgi:hypothetical protein